MVSLPKKNQKVLYFQQKELIESMLSDEAVAERRNNMSNILESHILNSMLPKNGNAAAFVRALYSSNTNDFELGKTFADVFSYLSGGFDRKAVADNGRPLVEHFHQLSLQAESATGKENDWNYLLSQFDSVITKLEKVGMKSGEVTELDIQYQRELFAKLERNPSGERFTVLTSIILEYWPVLRNFDRTYRLLMSMANMQKGIRNDAEARYTLVQLLKEITDEWK